MPSGNRQKQRQIPLKKPYQNTGVPLVERRPTPDAGNLIRFLSTDLSLFPPQPCADHCPHLL